MEKPAKMTQKGIHAEKKNSLNSLKFHNKQGAVCCGTLKSLFIYFFKYNGRGPSCSIPQHLQRTRSFIGLLHRVDRVHILLARC